MKIKYKIYPLPNGKWVAAWDLTKEQRYAANDLAWYGRYEPTRVKGIFFRKKNEKAILERKCEEYVERLCERLEYTRYAKKLREDAPMIEHGCDG